MDRFEDLYVSDGETFLPVFYLITAIQDIHYPRTTLSHSEVCAGCEEPSGGEFEVGYPCPTIESLEDSLLEMRRKCQKMRKK